MIRFECPMCGEPLRIHDSQGGKVRPCPACEHRIIIPKVAAPVAPAVRQPRSRHDARADAKPTSA
jgi:DNA-directed RNA polymerase subunit RPC12/RpoP